MDVVNKAFVVWTLLMSYLFVITIRFFFLRVYGTKCSGCKTTIPANEFVMRALGNVYHIQCFVCTMCGHRLEKGQEFALKENKLYCREDYGKLPAKGSSSSPPRKQQQESEFLVLIRFVDIFLFLSVMKTEWFNIYPSSNDKSSFKLTYCLK